MTTGNKIERLGSVQKSIPPLGMWRQEDKEVSVIPEYTKSVSKKPKTTKPIIIQGLRYSSAPDLLEVPGMILNTPLRTYAN